MRRILALTLVVVAVLVVLAPSASAATPTPTEKKLQKQVVTLQKQVKTLQRQMQQTQLVVLGTIALTSCTIAATADAFQGTWQIVDQATGKSNFGAQTALNDKGLCTRIKIPRSQTLPPSTSVLSLLYGTFNP